jgi:hypothetical protein
MSDKQLKKQAFRKGLIQSATHEPALKIPEFGSLRTVRDHFASADEAIDTLRRAVEDFEVEYDSIEGMFPCIDMRNLVRLQVVGIALDIEPLKKPAQEPPPEKPVQPEAPQAPEQPVSHPTGNEPHGLAQGDGPTGSDGPPLTQEPKDHGLKVEPAEIEVKPPEAPPAERASRRTAMLEAREIMRDFSQGEMLTFEDVDERIQASSDPALVRNLVTGVRTGSVSWDPEGDFSWEGVQAITHRLPMRTELVVEGQLRNIGRMDLRTLKLADSVVLTSMYEGTVRANLSARSEVLTLQYDSVELARSILFLTAADLALRYRATVMRGVAGAKKFEFRVINAEPIDDEATVSAKVNKLLAEQQQRRRPQGDGSI